MIWSHLVISKNFFIRDMEIGLSYQVYFLIDLNKARESGSFYNLV